MTLDTHRNQDLHSLHDLHTTITQDLTDNDPKQIDRSTPKRLHNSYYKLFYPETGVAPSSDRIIDDVERVLGSLEFVLIVAEGCIIDEKNTRSGIYNLRQSSTTLKLLTVGEGSKQNYHKKGTYFN